MVSATQGGGWIEEMENAQKNKPDAPFTSVFSPNDHSLDDIDIIRKKYLNMFADPKANSGKNFETSGGSKVSKHSKLSEPRNSRANQPIVEASIDNLINTIKSTKLN